MKKQKKGQETVINVGGKEYRFTWSREVGDLCDIYEQHQSGEDGNGLLFESGCAWRKVNVQRILDESTKNHVKMLSEEADRKHKSRKAIVLDYSNPSIKRLAAAEANPRRVGLNLKKEPPSKKRKVGPVQVGGPHKLFKTGNTCAANPRGRFSSSPLPSTPEHADVPESPLGTGSSTKIHTSTGKIVSNQFKGKQNAGSEKMISSGSGSATGETPSGNSHSGVKLVDIERMLKSLLMDNKTNGMTIKALEKAIQDAVPGSSRKIEPILEKIAICQASGRYFIKSGVDMEIGNKPFLSKSSRDDDRKHTLALEDSHEKRPTPENPAACLEEPLHPQSDSRVNLDAGASEKIDIMRQSPDLFGERKDSDNNEGRECNSSDNESDSDSGSDSGTSSRIRSKGRSHSASPVGGGSSSDNDADSYSSGKEGSDEDVDILTSDDRKPQDKLQASEPGFSSSPDQSRSLHNGLDEKQDGEGSDTIDIAGDGSADGGIEVYESADINIDKDLVDEGKESEGAANANLIPGKEGDILQDREDLTGNLFDDSKIALKDGFRVEVCASSKKTSKGEYKKGSDKMQLDAKSEFMKEQKSDSLTRAINSRIWDAQLSKSPHDRHLGNTCKSSIIEGVIKNGEGTADLHLLKGRKETTPGKTVFELQPSARTSKQCEQVKASGTIGKTRLAESIGHRHNSSDKSSLAREPSHVQQRENHYRSSQSLQREVSNLKLGELREPLLEETPTGKQFDRKGPSKQTENGSITTDCNNTDINEGRCIRKEIEETRWSSPYNLMRYQQQRPEGAMRSLQKVGQSHLQNLPRTENAKVGSQLNKLTDGNRLHRNEDVTRVGSDVEGCGENPKKLHGVNQMHDLKCGVPSHMIKQHKARTSNTMVEKANVQKDNIVTKDNNRAGKRREPSPEQDTSLYKYEKDTPELKGPIRDFAQYREYVEEYRDKYQIYWTLKEILESYSNHFLNMGKDLQFSEGQDLERYRMILAQLKESYCQYGVKHKRFKKIFVVLHEELKNIKQRIEDFATTSKKD
ncbi:hypothetical protein LINPERHAP2_LOCUS24477 [Linum perenne]